MRSIKEMNDMDIFDTGVKFILDFAKNDLLPHFIYCGEHYYWTENLNLLEEMFLEIMKRYGIKNAILTRLRMWRSKIVTIEKVKKAYNG